MTIDIQTIEEMFANIRENTDWNLDDAMLWGYFFTDPSPGKLKHLATVLEQDGYKFVDLFMPETDEGEAECHFLHVERIEPHTVLSLHERNQQFYALAEKHDIDTYDGMDVGPATGLDT